jgi:hypothetical protein
MGKTAQTAPSACAIWPTPLACARMATRYLLIIIAILTTIALSELLIQFHDFNKEQDCLAAGGARRCGPVIPIHR